jgi:hypothetical protein
MDTTNQLISGYTAYTDAEQLGAEVESDAPATASLIIFSSPICATTASVTIQLGC